MNMTITQHGLVLVQLETQQVTVSKNRHVKCQSFFQFKKKVPVICGCLNYSGGMNPDSSFSPKPTPPLTLTQSPKFN